jgi:cell cycle arrest protein BUB2
LAAPFLYTMPSELEAFFCFAKFIEESCPLYVQPTLEGVHRGLRVRAALPSTPVFQFLGFYASNSFSTDASRSWTQSCSTTCAQRISLPNCMLSPVSTLSNPVAVSHTQYLAVLTLCACTPPLDQVLRLWDFLLAFGVHLNVLCVIAQLLLIRDDVMSSSS